MTAPTFQENEVDRSRCDRQLGAHERRSGRIVFGPWRPRACFPGDFFHVHCRRVFRDSRRGGGGDDLLDGGDGTDTLSGELGSDTLTGGAGWDQFIFGGDDDVIIDFEDNKDTILFDLWDGQAAADILDIGRISGSDAVFTIDGHSLTVQGGSSLAVLENDMASL